MGGLGLVLGVLELVVDLRAHRLLVRVGVGLRLLALAADGLVGRLLRLGDALLDTPRVLALGLREPRTPALADLAGAVGPLLGLLRRLDGTFLGLLGPLRGLARPAHAHLDGVAPDRRGIQHRRGRLATAVAGAGRGGLRDVADRLGRLQGAGQQPRGVGRHLSQTRSSPLRQRHRTSKW